MERFDPKREIEPNKNNRPDFAVPHEGQPVELDKFEEELAVLQFEDIFNELSGRYEGSFHHMPIFKTDTLYLQTLPEKDGSYWSVMAINREEVSEAEEQLPLEEQVVKEIRIGKTVPGNSQEDYSSYRLDGAGAVRRLDVNLSRKGREENDLELRAKELLDSEEALTSREAREIAFNNAIENKLFATEMGYRNQLVSPDEAGKLHELLTSTDIKLNPLMHK